MIKAVIFDCFGVVLDIMTNRKREAVIEYIASLRPQYKLAMLSNVSGRAGLDRLFNDGELDSLFDVVVASGDVGYDKPHPEIYRLTAEKLGVTPEECLFIDDIGRFAAAAEMVGMQSYTFVDQKISLQELKKITETQA